MSPIIRRGSFWRMCWKLNRYELMLSVHHTWNRAHIIEEFRRETWDTIDSYSFTAPLHYQQRGEEQSRSLQVLVGLINIQLLYTRSSLSMRMRCISATWTFHTLARERRYFLFSCAWVTAADLIPRFATLFTYYPTQHQNFEFFPSSFGEKIHR